VRFEEALARLRVLPEVLPDGPEELIPVLAGPDAERPRPDWEVPPGAARPAAVLIVLYPDAVGEAHLILTERADRGGHHSGEVSFPGGRVEPSDTDLIATALREAAEEVGLDPGECGLRVLGELPTQWIPVSNFTVAPIVAAAARRPSMRPQPSEVAAILDAPVRSFLPGAPLLTVERELRGFHVRYAAYPVAGLAVWGMTAKILGGLGAWLARDEAPDPAD
jgi:8-oxo-dGTP pyrophosphatase MutT (NUDIX family)